MGMFDSVRCEYPLVLKESCPELDKYSLNELVYQTKDLENALDQYIIHADGTLHVNRNDREWVEGNPEGETLFDRMGYSKVTKSWTEEVPRTITITFYELIQEDENKNDYWLQFEAVFVKGVLNTLVNTIIRVTDNTERKAREVAREVEAEQSAKLRQRWYMKYIYLPYARIVRFCFRKYGQLQQRLIPAYRIERWLTPW